MTTSPAPLRVIGLLGCAILATAQGSAAVYRCTGGGPPRFSQFPCGDATPVIVHPLDTVRVPPLSRAERARLDDLERQQEAAQKARDRARARLARTAQADRKKRRQRCETARKQQAALQRKRRRGYGIGEARALDRRAEELAAEVDANC